MLKLANEAHSIHNTMSRAFGFYVQTGKNGILLWSMV